MVCAPACVDSASATAAPAAKAQSFDFIALLSQPCADSPSAPELLL
jgi:hypothetical protein